MIINQSTETIESGGLTKSNQFSMKNGPHAFRVLSDSLYTDKPYAIMRELICNARDSQLEAKSDKKTTVTFPTQLCPTLSIRDYGTGLSEDDVMNLYTTYFDSTKGNSNEMIGAFGLGSKSPFSYTDEFSVTSWFDGEQKDYLVYIGEDGTPTLSLTNTQKSDEPSGLKVAIQIDKEDFDRFERAMLKLVFLGDYVEFRNFDLETWFTGLVDNLEGSGTLRLPIDYTLASNSLFSGYCVEMGGVVYPLPGQYVESLREMGLTGERNFIFHFPIGSVDVAPSREHLSVNKRTQKALDKFVGDIEESILKVFSEGIRNNTHLNDKEWLRTYRGLTYFIKTNFDSLPKDVQIKLERGSILTNECFCPGKLRITLSSTYSKAPLCLLFRDMYCSLFIPADGRLKNLYISTVNASQHTCIPSYPRYTFGPNSKGKTMFMFSQYKKPQAIGARVSEFQKTQEDLLTGANWDGAIFKMSFEEFKRQHKWLYKMLKNVARKGHILLVDLDKYKPPKKTGGRGKVHFHKVHAEYCPASESYSLERRVLSEDVFSTDKVYPVVFTPVTKFDGDDDRCSKIHEYQKLLDELTDLGKSYSDFTGTASQLFPLTQSVYLVSPTHKDNELFEDEETFITLDEALKEAKKRLETVKKQLNEALDETTKELTSDEEKDNTMLFIFNKKVDTTNYNLRYSNSLVRHLFKLPSELVHRTFFTYETRPALNAFISTDKAKEFFFEYLRENTKYRGPDDYGVYRDFLACLNEIDSDTESLSNRLNISQENILKSLKKDIDKAVEEVYKQNN